MSEAREHHRDSCLDNHSEDNCLVIQLAARVAAVEALVKGCYVHRSTDLSCTDLIGAYLKGGARWTADHCCLPCQVRATLRTDNREEKP